MTAVASSSQQAALKQLGLLRQQQGSDFILRVGVRSGGCSGMSYTKDFIQPQDVREDDKVYAYTLADGAGFQVVSDPKSLLYIYGLQLDFSTALIRWRLQLTPIPTPPRLAAAAVPSLSEGAPAVG